MKTIALILLLLLAPLAARASTVVVPLLPRPVDLDTSPALRIVAHGPESARFYRFTVEISNLTTGTMIIAPRFGGDVSAAQSDRLWVTWDNDRITTWPVQRMRVAWQGKPEAVVSSSDREHFVPAVAIPGDTLSAIDFDFELPAKTPARVTLHVDGLRLMTGLALTATHQFDVTAPYIIDRVRPSRGAPPSKAPARQPPANTPLTH